MSHPLALRDPRTGRDDGTVAALDLDDLAPVTARLRAGQPAWAATDPRDRGDALSAFASRLDHRRDALVAALLADTGRVRESRIEVDATMGLLRRWADQAPGLLADPPARDASVPGFAVAQDFVPHALVGVISPWNFPLLLAMIDTVPALAAGCAVVVKPSEVTPRFAAVLADALGELDAVLAIAVGDRETGAHVVDLVDMVCFTGSVRGGRAVAVRAAERLVPVALELGGKDPAVVLPGADLDHAARAILWGATSNAGQACQSIERVYVGAADHDALVARLVAGAEALRLAHPEPDDGEIGPIISPDQARVLEEHLDDARRRGAHVHTGGRIERLGGGAWLRPTVLTEVDHDMLVMREESFGPLVPVMRCADVDQAVALANDTRFGLSAAVFGPDADAAAVARRLHAGAVSVNDAALTAMIYDAEKQSFGCSGLGPSRMGPAALLRFGRRRAHLTNVAATADPWWWPTPTRSDA